MWKAGSERPGSNNQPTRFLDKVGLEKEPEHRWWNGQYHPHFDYEGPHMEPFCNQPKSPPSEPDEGEWMRYRRRKSFLTGLGGW